jgi:hypothetical protein
MRKKAPHAHSTKAKSVSLAAAAHNRAFAARSAAKRHRLADRAHFALPSTKTPSPTEIMQSRTVAWMGSLQTVGMAERFDTPRPSAHWDIEGRSTNSGRSAGSSRIAPTQTLIAWPISPAYDISALTAAQGNLIDPDIEWNDIDGNAVINPPSEANDPTDMQPVLSPNQYYAGLIEDRADAPLPKIEIGTVTWNTPAQISAQKTPGPVEIAEVNNTPANLAARIYLCCRATAGAAPSQLILDVVFASQPQADKVDVLDNPEAREAGDIHGERLHGDVQSEGSNAFRFLLSLTRGDFDENFKLLISRPWIDIPVQFDSGRRAILTFATGKVGADAIYAAVHSAD